MANSAHNTLRKLLVQRKPDVQCTTTSTRNTTNGEWPDMTDRVTLWNEFSLDTLNDSYGDVLDAHLYQRLENLPQPDEAFNGLVVNSDGDVKHFIKWNHDIVKPTLDFAQCHLKLRPGRQLCHNYSPPGSSSRAGPLGGSNTFLLHHLIELRDTVSQNLVIGLARTSTKWSGLALGASLRAGRSVSNEQLWPIRQLSRLCEHHATRFGYIQTDKELSVFCFSLNGTGQLKASMMPIPLSNYSENVLTADLGLWWLTMLALSSPNNTAIVAENQMVPLNAWHDVVPDGRGVWVRRHHYSGREVAVPQPNANFDDANIENVGLPPNDIDFGNMNVDVDFGNIDFWGQFEQ